MTGCRWFLSLGSAGILRSQNPVRKKPQVPNQLPKGRRPFLCMACVMALLIATEILAQDQTAGPVASTDAKLTGGVKAKSPQDAIATIHVKPGYRVELVAAEPLIQSPVAINFGPDGRLWVAEMWDYPAGASGRYEPGGRVRCCYDDDNDGRYDRSEIFLEGIPFPTGVCVWNKGILVCAAPDIIYAEDTNGDGKADIVSKRFSGFATGNFHSRVNSLEYGLDGWVYGACGGFGMAITSSLTRSEIRLGRRDFRIKPDTGEFEPVSGGTQQGRVRNDWDDWFGCNNLVLLQHYPFCEQYLKRNHFLKLPPAVVQIEAGPEPGRLYSISEQTRFKLSGPPNRPTAVCGIGIYRDELLGPGYMGNAFSCESVNNLVHRQILLPSGATFTSRRGDDEADREFLASSDPWFRPVQARTGPDGGLWIVDMYRYVIEHPIWIPPEALATLDTRAGADMGRIYRIVPNDTPRRKSVRLDRLNGEQLVAALDTPNGIQRDLAQQLLIWRNERGTIPQLKRLAEQSTRPEVRMQALCTWSVFEQPSDDALLKALADKHGGVRRHAVRIAEPRMNDSGEVAYAVARLANDDDTMVRMQVAYVLGSWTSPRSAAVLADQLAHNAQDAYVRAAIESSFTPSNVVTVLDFLQQQAAQEASGPLLDQVVSQAASLADLPAIEALLRSLGKSVAENPSAASLQRFANFLEGWNRGRRSSAELQTPAVREGWQPAMEKAVVVAKDESFELPVRLAAVQLLAQGPTLNQSYAEGLIALLTPRAPAELQSAVVTALGRHDDPMIADSLLGSWSALSPKVRKDLIPMLVSRPAWAKSLVRAVEQRSLSATDFNILQQQALLNHSDEAIKALAEKAFRSASASTRQEVIDHYAAGLNDRGDATRGRQVFQKHCSQCHRIQDFGHAVGPDITSYGGKPGQALLIAMFDPNQAVEPRFQSYSIALTDGRTAIGQIAEESTAGFTLLMAEGKKQSILRSEIDEMRNTGKSLMPEGFEKQVTLEDFSDLWAYIRSWHQPPKSFPGNRPEIVEISNRRKNALRVSQAEIFGRDIAFDPAVQSVASWHDQQDFVRWKIKSPRIFDFDVWTEWACASDGAGNPFRLEIQDAALTGAVLSTGGWDIYQFQRIGTIRVPEGESEVILRPGEGLRKNLANVRAVHLVNRGAVPEAAGRVELPGQNTGNSAMEIARFLLDDGNPQADREKRIADSLDGVSKAIPMMVIGLPEEPGSPEEYRRIPWIWRVAIAIGKTKDPDRIREVLSASLPGADQRLEHWQAVVLGGGIINGISRSGEFPLPLIEKSIGDNQDLKKRWQRSLELSLPMCDELKVPPGTRYDALRMCPLLGWKRSGPVLEKYLKSENEELQMGAISGMSDVDDDAVAPLLLADLPNYPMRNRRLALDALVRTEQRCLVLLHAVADKKLSATDLGPERVEKLVKHASEKVRQQAMSLLPSQ